MNPASNIIKAYRNNKFIFMITNYIFVMVSQCVFYIFKNILVCNKIKLHIVNVWKNCTDGGIDGYDSL